MKRLVLSAGLIATAAAFAPLDFDNSVSPFAINAAVADEDNRNRALQGQGGGQYWGNDNDNNANRNQNWGYNPGQQNARTNRSDSECTRANGCRKSMIRVRNGGNGNGDSGGDDD